MIVPPAPRVPRSLVVLPAIVALLEATFLLGLAGNFDFNAIRYLYDVHTLWMPALLLPAGISLRAARRRGAHLCLALGLALGAVRLWCTHVEPGMLLVRRIVVDTGKLSRPLRVLHLSDMQPVRVGSHERRIMAKARALAPDLLLYTGDLVQPREDPEREIRRMAELLATVTPPLGKWAVEGDTDRRIRGRPPQELGGMRLLEAAEATIDAPGGRIRLLGLTLDQSRANVRPAVARWLAGGGPRDVSIVMGHAPDYVLSLQRTPADLCLAGHTHGGQVVIPWYGPPYIASMVPRAWAKGLHAFGATRVHVSAGAGAEHGWGLPSLRFNCPSEMTLIELS